MSSNLLLILIIFYAFVIILNYRGYSKNTVSSILTVATVFISCYMLCATNYVSFNGDETDLDIAGYRTQYEIYDALEHADFRMYYMFYGLMHFGQVLGLSFKLWWTIMSVSAMGVLIIACRVHKYNINLFLATFMAYYEIVFYSGLKFFYGFCFFLLAYGFLLSNTRKSQWLYVLFTLIAGGFHVMYYYFLLFLFKPLKNPKTFVWIVAVLTVLFTLLARVSGNALSFMIPFFDAIDSEHISRYTEGTVHSGFYLAVFIHAVVVFIAYRVRKQSHQYDKDVEKSDTLFYSVLLSLLFCPFYTIALTFLRLITAFSLIVVTASSSLLSDSYKSRVLCSRMSLLMVFAFYLMRVFMGGFFQTSVIPYFDVF